MASDYVELITKGCEELPSGNRDKYNMKSGDLCIIEADPQIDADHSKVEVLHHALIELKTSELVSNTKGMRTVIFLVDSGVTEVNHLAQGCKEKRSK